MRSTKTQPHVPVGVSKEKDEFTLKSSLKQESPSAFTDQLTAVGSLLCVRDRRRARSSLYDQRDTMQSLVSRIGSLILSNAYASLRAQGGNIALMPSVHPTAAGPLTIQVRGILRKFFARPSNTLRLRKHGSVFSS
ncbi:hypothetical protein BIW11_10056 [Tropilaelaps mercedesae]|uniref:Uncharacterized protein n=1 Tax=Tropilaelaps mercedesae TaxID=418985 RepID=A0A1V9XHS5_9ACAR|nr:hypothetical protein BIW11_10056 [Tropilaelaps mercedesae]